MCEWRESRVIHIAFRVSDWTRKVARCTLLVCKINQNFPSFFRTSSSLCVVLVRWLAFPLINNRDERLKLNYEHCVLYCNGSVISCLAVIHIPYWCYAPSSVRFLLCYVIYINITISLPTESGLPSLSLPPVLAY